MNKKYTYLLGASLLALSITGIANNQPATNNHKKNLVSYAQNKSNNSTDNKAINDASIVSQIKDKINKDSLLRNIPLEISSEYGNVIISGLVDTKLQAEKIVVIAQSNKWTKNIDTENLKIKNSKQPLTDSYITAKVKGALLRDMPLNIKIPKNIHIETKNKIVYLSGYASSQAEVDEIINTVKSISDISNIENNIQIKK